MPRRSPAWAPMPPRSASGTPRHETERGDRYGGLRGAVRPADPGGAPGLPRTCHRDPARPLADVARLLRLREAVWRRDGIVRRLLRLHRLVIGRASCRERVVQDL